MAQLAAARALWRRAQARSALLVRLPQGRCVPQIRRVRAHACHPSLMPHFFACVLVCLLAIEMNFIVRLVVRAGGDPGSVQCRRPCCTHVWWRKGAVLKTTVGAAHGERKKKMIGLRGGPFVGDFPGAASIMGAQRFEFLLCKVYLQS